MRACLYAFALLVLASPASASKWFWLTGKSASQYFGDGESITVKGDARDLWVRSYFSPAIRDVAFTMEMYRFNCRARVVRVLDQRAFTALGDQKYTRTFSEYTAVVENIAPDSTMETLFDFACQPLPVASVRREVAINRTPADTARLIFRLTPHVSNAFYAALLASVSDEEVEAVIKEFAPKWSKPGHLATIQQILRAAGAAN